MKRVLFVIGVAASLLLTASSARAASVTVHKDPNDSSGALDVRQVSSRAGRHRVYLRLTTWDAFRVHDDLAGNPFNYIGVRMDTRGSRGYDRILIVVSAGGDDVNGTTKGTTCEVWSTSSGAKLLGHRSGRKLDKRDVSCRVPKSWLGIKRRVRFTVQTKSQGHIVDRAPNRGRYVGL